MALLLQQWYTALVLLKGKGQGRLEQPGATNPTGQLGKGEDSLWLPFQPGSRRRQQPSYQSPQHTYQ